MRCHEAKVSQRVADDEHLIAARAGSLSQDQGMIDGSCETDCLFGIDVIDRIQVQALRRLDIASSRRDKFGAEALKLVKSAGLTERLVSLSFGGSVMPARGSGGPTRGRHCSGSRDRMAIGAPHDALLAVPWLVELNAEGTGNLEEGHQPIASVLNFLGEFDATHSKFADGLTNVIAVE